MRKFLMMYLLLVYSIVGYAQKETQRRLLDSPGKKKMEELIKKAREGKDYSFFETPAINNTANATEILLWSKEDFKTEWVLTGKENPIFQDETNFLKENIHSMYFSYDNTFMPYMKAIYEFDDQHRPTKLEYYFSDGYNKDWMLQYYEVYEYDFRGDVVYYAFYSSYYEGQEPTMLWGYKAEDEENDQGYLISRIWMYFSDEWMPYYREEYIRDESNNWIETYYSYYTGYLADWKYDIWEVYTLDESNQWEEAIIYFAPPPYVKPIYLLGSGTQAGWNNNQALEMTHLWGGEFGIVTTLRENGDMIKFISVPGQWAPQWGYGGWGDEYYGGLSYRPTESVPDPPAIMITGLTPGEYVVYADTAYLYYEIYSMDDWDKKKTENKVKKEEIGWMPVYKATDVEWYNFEMLMPSQVILWYNENLLDDWKNTKEEETQWVKDEKSIWEYNEDGKLILQIYYYWEEFLSNEDNWIPSGRFTASYDHLGNCGGITYSYWDEYENEWFEYEGLRVNFYFNENGSINNYVIYYLDNWGKGYEEVQKYVYYYSDMYNLSIEINPAGAGNATGAGMYGHGQQVNLSATAATGFVFQNWTHNGVVMSAAESFIFDMPDHDVTMVANFEVSSTVGDVATGNTRVYPNPVTDLLYLELPGNSESAVVSLYSTDGTKVLQNTHKTGSSIIQINMAPLSPGVYFLRVESETKTFTEKVVKR